MNREIREKIRVIVFQKALVHWCLVAVATLVTAGTMALGADARGRRGDLVHGKITAPNMEDLADYYAPSRNGVSIEDLKKADELRLKTVASIQALLKERDEKSGRHFELILRMGELFVERHDYLRDIELAQYTKDYDQWQQSPKDKRGKEPKLTYTGSTAELTKAVNSFRLLVSEYPKHPRTDAALYALAKTLSRLGNDNAVNYYKELIANHPNSPLIPDAHLALGEFYFEKHKIAPAIDSYKSVMKFKEHKAYPFAVYKLGWAYYNNDAKNDADAQENYKKAVAAFKLIVKLSEQEKTKQQTANLNLREEAIKDLVMVWAEAEDTDSAWKYFKTIGEEASFYTMLERLGWIYSEHGENAKAIVVYQRLLKEAPNRVGNAKIYAKLVELQDLNNQTQAVVASLETMPKLYLGNSAWVIANKAKTKDVDEAARLVELTMHRYGTIYHNRGQKAKSDTYLHAAASIYTDYLSAFPEHDNAYDVRFYLAELLYDFNKLDQASDHYSIVAKARPKDGKNLKTAALNSVSAMSKLVALTKFDAVPPAGQVTQPIEIPKVKAKMISRMDEYVSLLPQEKDGHAMRFTVAQTYFDYGHYDQALKRFETVTTELPTTKQAAASVRIILGYYSEKDQWGEVVARCKKFSASSVLMADASLKKLIEQTLRHASFKNAMALEKANKIEDAARAYLAFQKDFPTDENADKALYNASLNFYKISMVEDAISAQKLILEKYPKSAVRDDVMAQIAVTYEALAQFQNAASFYQQYARDFPKSKQAPGALYNSAILYKGVQNLDLAAKLLNEFVKTHPKHEIVGDAWMELGGILERQARYPEAMEAYLGYTRLKDGNKDRALFAFAKAAELRTFRVNEKQGRVELEKLRKELSAPNAPAAFDARQTVAGVLFKLTDPAFNEFKSITVGSQGIEKQIQRKQERLEKLAEAYEQIMALSSPEFTVASLYRLGEMHEDFSGALLRTPGQTGSSQAEVDQLKTQLEKLAFPLRDEAYKFYETAYKRSSEVDTFTIWTKRTYQKMAELQPQKHPEITEQSTDAAYMTNRVTLTDATKSLTE